MSRNNLIKEALCVCTWSVSGYWCRRRPDWEFQDDWRKRSPCSHPTRPPQHGHSSARAHTHKHNYCTSYENDHCFQINKEFIVTTRLLLLGLPCGRKKGYTQDTTALNSANLHPRQETMHVVPLQQNHTQFISIAQRVTGSFYLQSGRRSHVRRRRVALPASKSVDMADAGARNKEQLAATLPDLY